LQGNSTDNYHELSLISWPLADPNSLNPVAFPRSGWC